MADKYEASVNGLANSRSPYLLQHASNPVDWMEWGDVAFEAARKRDVPIFLSIGYSTCHWCHVMAHESFEDESIAHRMNSLFVNIKLDREERPDVDRIYMSYVQSTTGSGGWPMSVWLTPDLKPFYGGTYFPPEDKYGRVGFLTLIERIGKLWIDERSTLFEYGEKSSQLLLKNASQDTGDEIASAGPAIERCLDQLEGEYDAEFGGFGSAPKFPMPVYFALLIEQANRRQNAKLTEMLTTSLRKMALGGIWDHVEGGFHRYSVDKYWHIPHYEKMLYDQGQLSWVYAEVFRLTGDEFFRNIAINIVEYVAHNMLGKHGEFYAAEDADSPLPEDPSKQKEGAFYVWTESELSSLLAGDVTLFSAAYDVKREGNARPESDPHGELEGTNTLMRVQDSSTLAAYFEMTEGDVEDRLVKCLDVLQRERSKRPRPHLDDKSIVSWNALMVSGACKVYQSCGDKRALKLAVDAGEFVFDRMWDSEAQAFYRTFRITRGENLGFAEDYACMANACVDLFESGLGGVWLERAKAVVGQLVHRFLDQKRGGFYSTEETEASLIVRLRDDYDGAEPCASSMAAVALLRIAALTDDSEMRELGRMTIEAFGAQWNRMPRAMPLMLVAASRFLESDQQVVVVGDFKSEVTLELLKTAYRWRKSYSVLVCLDTSDDFPEVFNGNENLGAMFGSNLNSSPKVFVCENYTCQAPVGSAEELVEILNRNR